MFLKVVVADRLGIFVNAVYENYQFYSGIDCFIASVFYSIQIYGDFAGYSLMALGIAKCLGIDLINNFERPYLATSITSFWKRWHISLTQWLTRQIYIPLGGSRTSKIKTYRNILITFIVSGIWHGASWNFIIWGGLNGGGMIVYQLWKKTTWHLRMVFMTLLSAGLIVIRHYYPIPIWKLLTVWMLVIYAGFIVRYIYHLCNGRKGEGLGNIWGIVQTFTFITFTRLFFRSGSNLDPATANTEAWNTAKNMVQQIGSKWNTAVIPDICSEYWKVFALVLIGMIIHWMPTRWKRWYRINFALLPLPIMVLAIVAVVFIIYQFVTADVQAFIYFQF